MQHVPLPGRIISRLSNIQPKARLARLLLQDEEPARVAARQLFGQVKAEEGDVGFEQATENGLSLVDA